MVIVTRHSPLRYLKNTRAKTTAAIAFVLMLAMVAVEIKSASGFQSEYGECCPQGCLAACCNKAASVNQVCAPPFGEWNRSYSACNTGPAVESTAAFEWKISPPQERTEFFITQIDLLPFSSIRHLHDNFSIEPPDPPPRSRCTWLLSTMHLDSFCRRELS